MELKGLPTGAIFKRCTAPIAIRAAARVSKKSWIHVIPCDWDWTETIKARYIMFNLRLFKQQKTQGASTMVRYLVALSIVALTMFAPAVAAEFGTKEEAIAMVKRVQEQFKKDGPELTFKAVSDKSTKEYHDRDLYPFVYDMRGANKGLNVAHGARPALVGKNLIDLKDQDGKYLIREMVDIANGPGTGWIDYKWPNPITSKIEDKSSYIEKMGDYFVGVGIYKQ